jgi:hypothetical protein
MEGEAQGEAKDKSSNNGSSNKISLNWTPKNTFGNISSHLVIFVCNN